MILRSWRNYDVKAVSLQNACDTGTDTKVIQSARDDSDINVIVKRFGVTGMIPQHSKVPTFGDFDTVVDYRSAMQAVRAAAESFMALPSKLRERFHNDPQEYVEFCSKPENLPEMQELGLTAKPPKRYNKPEEKFLEKNKGSEDNERQTTPGSPEPGKPPEGGANRNANSDRRAGGVSQGASGSASGEA